MKVHDLHLFTGDHEFSIIVEAGEIAYIVINRQTHFTLEEFEEMVQRVQDFNPEDESDE